MGGQKCIPAGRECFVHLGLNCSNPLSFQFAEGFWLIASGGKRNGLSFSDAKTAGDVAGCGWFLNNAGRGFRFHGVGLGFIDSGEYNRKIVALLNSQKTRAALGCDRMI